jgi:hypothetical protein
MPVAGGLVGSGERGGAGSPVALGGAAVGSVPDEQAVASSTANAVTQYRIMCRPLDAPAVNCWDVRGPGSLARGSSLAAAQSGSA